MSFMDGPCLGHPDGAGVDLAGAVVVDRAALPHAEVGRPVRALDVEHQVLHEGNLVLKFKSKMIRNQM